MNEKIRQLAEEATTYIEPTANSGEGWIFDKEKFAELIVAECADYANWYQANSRYTDIAKAIKEHFGVAE